MAVIDESPKSTPNEDMSLPVPRRLQLAAGVLGTEVRHEVRLLKHDPVPLATVVVLPFVFLIFGAPAYNHLAGVRNGTSFLLPGVSVMFAFLLVPFAGFSLFREHGWQTWRRIRSLVSSPGTVLLGKLVPWLFIAVIQLLLVPAIAAVVLGFDTRGSWTAYTLVAVATAVCVCGLTFLAYAISSSVYALNAVGNVGAIIFGGLGGALAPLQKLPGWVQAIAHVVPTYWAIRGLRDVCIGGAGLLAVLPACAVLVLFAAAAAVIGVWRLDVSAEKRSW